MPTRAAFYYAWYPGHWNEGSVNTPVLGHYSSTDPSVIDQHIAWAQYAGLDAYISSWWGPHDDFGTGAALPVPNSAAIPYSETVTPGWQKPDQTPKLPRDPVQFEQAVTMMARHGLPWQLVSTFSEWGEGSVVEPATEFTPTSQYLDILRRHFVPEE